MPIVAILVVAPLALLASPFLTVNVENAQPTTIDTTEVTWEVAMSRCSSYAPGWTLPSIYQLVAINFKRSDVNLIKDTDYWTRNSIAGYAFGLNTALGIPSFDKHADTDHFLCVEKL